MQKELSAAYHELCRIEVVQETLQHASQHASQPHGCMKQHDSAHVQSWIKLANIQACNE